MSFSRADLVRRQLGTATQLFLDNKDPISVHCLVSSSAEHASFLAKKHGGNVFNEHILATFPDRTMKDVRKIRNRVWNRLKHAEDMGGREKDVEAELEGFSDETNDHALFVVWHDFSQSGQPLPLEAQVFQVWYLELYPEKLNPEHAAAGGRTSVFGELRKETRAEMKRRLRDAISHYKTDTDLMDHAKTDPRPLVLD